MDALLGRTLTVLLLLGVLALAVVGSANAFWSSPGSGSGGGGTGTTVAMTLSPGSPTTFLAPGGQTSVVLTVSNPNPSPVFVSSFGLDTAQGTGGFSVDAGHSACDVAALSVTTQTNDGGGWTVPGKVGAVAGTLPVTLTNALSMNTAGANACQAAIFTVYLAASS